MKKIKTKLKNLLKSKKQMFKYISFGLLVIGGLISIIMILFTKISLFISLISGGLFMLLGLFFYFFKYKKLNDEVEIDQKPIDSLDSKLFIFMNDLAIYMCQGNSFNTSYDLALEKTNDKSLVETINEYALNKTGQINNSVYKDKIDFVIENGNKLSGDDLIKNIEIYSNNELDKKYFIQTISILLLLVLFIFIFINFLNK